MSAMENAHPASIELKISIGPLHAPMDCIILGAVCCAMHKANSPNGKLNKIALAINLSMLILSKNLKCFEQLYNRHCVEPYHNVFSIEYYETNARCIPTHLHTTDSTRDCPRTRTSTPTHAHTAAHAHARAHVRSHTPRATLEPTRTQHIHSAHNLRTHSTSCVCALTHIYSLQRNAKVNLLEVPSASNKVTPRQR